MEKKELYLAFKELEISSLSIEKKRKGALSCITLQPIIIKLIVMEESIKY